MQRFTYHLTGDGLKTQITSMGAVLAFDMVVAFVLLLVLKRPWNLVVFVPYMLGMGAAYWALTKGLRTRHRLDDQQLVLHLGWFRMVVNRRLIMAAEFCHDPLPRTVPVPSLNGHYRTEEDTLYVLAGRKGRVAIRLSEPLEARIRRQGFVQFTRLVISLDEPEQFLAAIAGTPDLHRPAAEASPGSAAATPASATAGRGSAAIQLIDLAKRFDDFVAVRPISLDVAPGEVLAFLGSNGAGKTTTIRMMTGLLRPSDGQVLMGGHDVWAGGPEARRLVGYVPDVPLLAEGLTAREFLWFIAGLHEMKPAAGRHRAAELLEFLQMERWADHLIRPFSLGMKRKMAIAAALVHRPRVLLLDEVTNGLDPRAAREVKDFLAREAKEGTAVFLTTHILDVAQELAHRIAIIDRGELKALGTIAELQAQAGLPGAGLEELFLALTETGGRQGVGA